MGKPVIFSTKITVRYQETDQMGVAHHSVYPIWFEQSRTEFIREYGFPYSKLESAGLYLPLIDVACKFKNFSRYEDELSVLTRISDVTKSRLSFMYEVIKGGLTIALGSTVHVYANRILKPVNLKKYMPELYETFCRIAGLDAVCAPGAAGAAGGV